MGWARGTFPSGAALPDEQWERHHAIVLRVLVALAIVLSAYGVVPGFDLLHGAGHALPLALLTAVSSSRALPRVYRAAAASTGLMTAAALAVHAAHGATEAHFLFFALLPFAALYAARTPLLVAVGYVAVHHVALGTLAPEYVFADDAWALAMAGVHAAFLLAEGVACMVAWRLFEDRRELVERLVLERTAELRATAAKLEDQAQELSHIALHDPLTGLANRVLMQDRLSRTVAGRGTRQHAVLLLDLDDFKTVNDVWGHAVGDAVLVEAARRLEACVRAGETVCRLGGDEFVILLDDVTDRDGVVAAVDRIRAALAEPIDAGVEQFALQASVGITLARRADGRGATELLRDADIAMYAAKAAGKGRSQVFESWMHDSVVAHDELVRDLHSAVDNAELRLLYQPQVDLATGRLFGVEALVRWERSGHGLIGPEAFIPTAEQTGMVSAIDDWVLREACAQLRAWDDAGLEPLRLAVNVSASRLVTGDLALAIAAVTSHTGLDADRLEVEITETVVVEHDSLAIETIRELRALGVHVAVDDFGMGHSSLSRLQSFPVDRLKIDRSFVAPLGDGTARASIAGAMIALGGSLGLDVIAEGVETPRQLAALRTLGCTAAQGYLFSEPVTADAIQRLVRTGAPFAPWQRDVA